jgi:hypothetical protein
VDEPVRRSTSKWRPLGLCAERDPVGWSGYAGFLVHCSEWRRFWPRAECNVGQCGLDEEMLRAEGPYPVPIGGTSQTSITRRCRLPSLEASSTSPSPRSAASAVRRRSLRDRASSVGIPYENPTILCRHTPQKRLSVSPRAQPWGVCMRGARRDATAIAPILASGQPPLRDSHPGILTADADPLVRLAVVGCTWNHRSSRSPGMKRIECQRM